MKVFLFSLILLTTSLTYSQSITEDQDVFIDELGYLFLNNKSDMTIIIDAFNSEVSKSKGKKFKEKTKVKFINDSLIQFNYYGKNYYSVISNNEFIDSDSIGRILWPTSFQSSVIDSGNYIIKDSYLISNNDTSYYHTILDKKKVLGSLNSQSFNYKYVNGIKTYTSEYQIHSELINNCKTVNYKYSQMDDNGAIQTEKITEYKSYFTFNKLNQIIKIEKFEYVQDNQELYLYESHTLKIKYK